MTRASQKQNITIFNSNSLSLLLLITNMAVQLGEPPDNKSIVTSSVSAVRR